MNSEKLHREISITMQFQDWCLLLGMLNSIIERSVPVADDVVTMQTTNLARIPRREKPASQVGPRIDIAPQEVRELIEHSWPQHIADEP